MTPEEEALLRAALKSALEMAPTQIIFCGADEEDEETLAFSLVEFEGGAVGIILPSAWETIPDMPERCQGLLAQEEKALVMGQFEFSLGSGCDSAESFAHEAKNRARHDRGSDAARVRPRCIQQCAHAGRPSGGRSPSADQYAGLLQRCDGDPSPSNRTPGRRVACGSYRDGTDCCRSRLGADLRGDGVVARRRLTSVASTYPAPIPTPSAATNHAQLGTSALTTVSRATFPAASYVRQNNERFGPEIGRSGRETMACILGDSGASFAVLGGSNLLAPRGLSGLFLVRSSVNNTLSARRANFPGDGCPQARLQSNRIPGRRSSYAGHAAFLPRVGREEANGQEAQSAGQEDLGAETCEQNPCEESSESLIELDRIGTFYVRPLRKVLSWASIESGVNRLDSKRRQQVIAAIVEGCSVRATCRMTGVAKGTVLRLIAELGAACDEYQDRALRDLPCKRVQCDEIWAFCYAKEKNVPARMKDMPGVGSVWTWTAIDADSKLAITWFVGDRTEKSAMKFMLDVSSRMAGRIQLTTDALKSYRYATTLAFDGDIDYAQLIKVYAGMPHDGPDSKYSQPQCVGTKVDVRHGSPDLDHVSTSYVERANLTMRMGMRRFTRLTNGFSKKIENHEHAVAIHFMHYNFCRKHESLKKMTPAMAAGVADHVWTLAELVALLPDQPAAPWGSVKKAKASADEPNSN